MAAALEILTYLVEQGNEGNIIHGTNDEIINAIHANENHDVPAISSKLRGTRIGLFGYPSDWLIASGVDYDYLREYYGVESVYIDLQRLIDGIHDISKAEAAKVADEIKKRAKSVKEPDDTDMIEAAKTYLVIKKLVDGLACYVVAHIHYEPLVIATRGTGIWGVFDDNKEMLYCDSQESFTLMLYQFIDNDEFRNEMARKAYEKTAQHYTWDEIISRYSEIYNSCLNG